MSPDVILFFRLGDFYEMFFDDAREAAPILDIALTRRNSVPMCGVPYHAVDTYLAKLIRAGKKVAICDQTEDASQAKGIVRREVTRIVTPGTIIEGNILEAKKNNFLAGVYRVGESFGVALLDLSTGLFQGEEICGVDAVQDMLRRLAPTECVTASEQMEDPDVKEILASLAGGQVSGGDDWTFDYETAYDSLVRHFAVHSLAGFGCEGKKALVSAAGGVLHYVKQRLRNEAGHVRALRVCSSSDFLILDEATCANLDLVPRLGGGDAPSLLDVLDVTRTAMGARMLRDWVLRPLAEAGAIRLRHDTVEALCNDRSLLREAGDALGGVRDLERLMSRIASGSGNARDVLALGESLAAVPKIRSLVETQSVTLLKELAAAMVPLPELVDLVRGAIAEDPPVTVKEGGIIRDGFNAELDDLRRATTEGRQWLAEYQTAEQARTGIKSLKVRHNKVFGYYIEVSKGQLANVPAEYVRKQTLVNAERFITPELKKYENKVLGAQEKAVALEYTLFLDIRAAVVKETGRVQATAEAIAVLDSLVSLADRALTLRYVRPSVTEDDRISLEESRHPVVEQMPDTERFVPNDAVLDGSANQLLIITGPNMAGKSTYIRQVALVVIMAHMGSFVPARKAEIGVVDRVFTRVGASDDLARGRSTFMVEMQETANILNNATARSLIVLDEIGRGTSTFDGISIAWAVAEYLHNYERVKAKTLFATHYHELTDLAVTMTGVRNYNVQVKERGDSVVFLRKIVPGGSDKSYGIQVARLAGMPQEVIDRSREILANLEEGELGESGQPKIARRRPRRSGVDPAQMVLFGDAAAEGGDH